MGWFKKTPAFNWRVDGDVRRNKRETVEAYLYERPGKRSELPEPRYRRDYTSGRYAYR